MTFNDRHLVQPLRLLFDLLDQPKSHLSDLLDKSRTFLYVLQEVDLGGSLSLNMGGKWGCMCDEGCSQVCHQHGFMLGAWAVVQEDGKGGCTPSAGTSG